VANKIALITGCTGQDGSYLCELLLSKGYEVHGLIRRNSAYEVNNIEHLRNKVTLHYGDIIGDNDLLHLIYQLKPDEMYNLAGQSDVKLSFECPEYTKEVNGKAVGQMLENIKHYSPKTKFYQASTSEMFGNSPPPQNENTPFNPQSPYAIGKEEAFREVVRARESGLFACNGILFNHESERRGVNFVTRKITKAIANIRTGRQNLLELGNLDAKRDWGYAPEYVQAMWLMLQQDTPDDYVIGTGKSHSVQEFLDLAFEYADLDPNKYVKIDQNLIRPIEVNFLLADPTKAKIKLGWSAKTTLKELVVRMVDSDFKGVRTRVPNK
jgi:GDPmannose 4,6-dehydratase